MTEGEALQFVGLPFFAPEIFQTVEVVDPMRAKQLGEALKQLGEEGAIQVFRPEVGGLMILRRGWSTAVRSGVASAVD